MSKRPGDWHLLGHDSDPVPGDWEEIQRSATHLSGIAETIADQVTRLRDIQDDDQILRGEYADGLKKSCGDLADDLDRVQGRFDAVGEELGTWWPSVQAARIETRNALQNAEAAQQVIDANPAPDPLAPGSPPPTEDQKGDEEVRSGKVGGANDDLDQARRDCDGAMSRYDDKAKKVADAIKDASDDDMKDSRWDKFKGWVDDNAGWLKKVADIISIVVTVVAVIALFCTPAGWILAIVAGIALLGVGIRFALAASGNGSWADFALDLVGVLTLGTGKIAIALAKGSRLASLKVVGKYAGTLARTDAIANARSLFQNARLFDKPLVWLTRSNPVARWIAGRGAYTSTKLAWLTKELPDVTKVEKVLAGLDDTGAAMMKEINAIKTAFPGLTAKALDSYATATNVAVNAGRTGAIVDGIDKLIGGNDVIPGVDIPAFGPYEDMKDHFTYAPGGHLG